MVKGLLDVGANMNLYNKAGITSFASACLHGEGSVTEYMLSLGADVNGGGQQPLFMACKGTVGKQMYR
jgi:ankyrin repeat protein